MVTVKRIDRSPARLTGGFAVGTGVLAAAPTATVTPVSLLAGVLGLVLVAAGVGFDRGRQRLVTVGAAVLFSGVLTAGAMGAPIELLLVGGTASILAWDFGQNAISVGEQLGRESRTTRAEIVHAAGSTIVATLTAGVGYAIYRVASGGQPIVALVFLLIAAIVLVSTLR